MKKVLFAVLLCSQALFVQAASADPLSPHAYLRKLSLHLTGLDPQVTDYQDLDKAIANNSSSQYFEKKISEYLTTANHVEKMNYRLSELFWLNSPSLPQDLTKDAKDSMNNGNRDGYLGHNSMNALFKDIVKDNMSWDTLLTGKTYKAYGYGENFGEISDYGFYGGVKTLPPTATGIIGKLDDTTYSFGSGKPGPDQNYVEIKFDPQDPRVAGAITTARFFERFSNTGLNKDRRRAAAIFRIFLCEPMQPAVVPPDSTKKKQLIDLSRLYQDPHGGSQVSSQLDGHAHGLRQIGVHRRRARGVPRVLPNRAVVAGKFHTRDAAHHQLVVHRRRGDRE